MLLRNKRIYIQFLYILFQVTFHSKSYMVSKYIYNSLLKYFLTSCFLLTKWVRGAFEFKELKIYLYKLKGRVENLCV